MVVRVTARGSLISSPGKYTRVGAASSLVIAGMSSGGRFLLGGGKVFRTKPGCFNFGHWVSVGMIELFRAGTELLRKVTTKLVVQKKLTMILQLILQNAKEYNHCISCCNKRNFLKTKMIF